MVWINVCNLMLARAGMQLRESIVDPGDDFCGSKEGLKIFEFFTRQALGNPIERQKRGRQRDKGVAVAVQNNLKKVKKNLVRGEILH
jgi:hypothetical protein